jgi:alkanesulfonate monooxygenase SsuD/methylene tetrahydromethanopterin reductase-like flavin-dependent oxidoreductase (luciferase family)
LGLGYFEPELSALDVRAEDRAGRLQETVAILKQFWTQSEINFEGRHFRFDHVPGHIHPIQKPHPPIWFGGNALNTIKRTVRLGDGWYPYNMTIEEFRAGVRRLREFAREVGRDPSTIQIGLVFHGNIARDDATAIEEARPFGPWLSTVDKDPRTAIEALLPRLIIGGPETCYKRVKAYIEAGCTQVNIIFTNAGREFEKMQLWAEHVIKPLKGLTVNT